LLLVTRIQRALDATVTMKLWPETLFVASDPTRCKCPPMQITGNSPMGTGHFPALASPLILAIQRSNLSRNNWKGGITRRTTRICPVLSPLESLSLLSWRLEVTTLSYLRELPQRYFSYLCDVLLTLGKTASLSELSERCWLSSGHIARTKSACNLYRHQPHLLHHKSINIHRLRHLYY